MGNNKKRKNHKKKPAQSQVADEQAGSVENANENAELKVEKQEEKPKTECQPKIPQKEAEVKEVKPEAVVSVKEKKKEEVKPPVEEKVKPKQVEEVKPVEPKNEVVEENQKEEPKVIMKSF